MNRRLIQHMVVVVWALIAPTAWCQILAQDSLAGDWEDGSGGQGINMTFYKTGQFAVMYIRPDINITKRIDGVYVLKDDTCHVGEEKGNLWLAANTDRCCVKAYAIAETLVLDPVGSRIAGSRVCEARTLRRAHAPLNKN